MRLNDEHYWKAFRAFIEAFAEITHHNLTEARLQWAMFSAQLSEEEIERIEYGGELSGYAEGARFNECFPPDEEDESHDCHSL